MRHTIVNEEVFELAVLYSLGALDEGEARAYEEHLLECEICRQEKATFEEVASNLPYGLAPQTPADELKSRLFEQIADQESDAGEAAPISAFPFVSIRADEGEWKNLWGGVMMKLLNFDSNLGLATSLIKMPPGSRLAEHRHEGIEQIFVLEGDCHIDGERLGPGDYHRAEAGSLHHSTYTETGTTFLLVAPLKYEFGTSH
jgi:anti-sigma factor ChrR (cupin superfamily)